MSTSREPFIRLSGISKKFGSFKALSSVDLSIDAGQVVGLVGHNGAGKSTLVSVMMGNLRAENGTIEEWSGREKRCVFQELSLCDNLTVVENTRLVHADLKGFGWRRRAGDMISEQLKKIFPNHGINVNKKISQLSIGQRQMVEIARAFTERDKPLGMVILDEPTSALGDVATRQFLDYTRTVADEGVCIVFISHRLNEIYRISDRVVVMKDGEIAAAGSPNQLPRSEIVRLMGGRVVSENQPSRPSVGDSTPVIRIPGVVDIVASSGEIIGFTGLEGHGQRETLIALQTGDIGRNIETSFVAGDRQNDGVLPAWSIAQNLTISSLDSIKRGGLLSYAKEREFAEDWKSRINIRSRSVTQRLTELSGGNQQKVLFARALASPSSVVLLDDPMRGVDVGTKAEVYETIRREAEAGRTFVWFSSEMEELENCDRVYVFREGAAVASLDRAGLSKEAIIAASFTN